MQPGVDQRRADRIWWANTVGGVALSIICGGAGLAFLLGAIQLEGEEDSSAGLGLLLFVIGVVFVFVTVRVARARRNTTAEERCQMAQSWVAAGELEDLPTPEHRAAMRQLKERARGASGVTEKDANEVEIADAWQATLPEGWHSAESSGRDSRPGSVAWGHG